MLRIPIRRGRTFAETDRADGPPVVVISETMARRYWPKGDALGARVRMGPDPQAPLMEVIGIVGDVRNGATQRTAEPMAYTSSRAAPWTDILLVRTSGDPLGSVRAIQRAITELDSGLPLHNATTLRSLLSDGLAGRRVPVLLMTAFGALALLLASVGIYAMFSAMADAREREFGVRMALGASPHTIAALVIRNGATWMGIGLALGAVGVFAVTRALQGLVFGISRFDPASLGVSVLLLVACAVVALLVPVRRAARVDPTTILR